MIITETPIADLTAHPRNSRTHSAEQIRALARAITHWKWTQPIVIDSDGVVLIGHGRLEAAKSLGLETVPTVRRDDLTDAEKRLLVISDNRLAELGSSWDKDVVDEELRFLALAEFDLSLTAFDLPEIGAPPEDAEPEEQPAVVQPGEHWLLGDGLLVCADGGDPSTIEALSSLTTAVLVTEVPKDVGAGLLAQLLTASKAKIAYLWQEGLRSHVAGHAADEAKLDVRAQIVVPTRARPRTKGFAPAHFLGLYCAKTGGPSWNGGRKQTTVWDSAEDLPLQHFTRPMRNHTGMGGAVLDPFAGESRGAVFLAATQTQRKALGFEPVPEACDEIIERWQAFTGKAATHGTNGQAYDTRKQAFAA